MMARCYWVEPCLKQSITVLECDMRTPAVPNSRGFTWVAAFCGVAMLYVLSFGPATYLQYRRTLPAAVSEARFTAFYRPVLWMHEQPRLKQVLYAYSDWWMTRGMAHRSRSVRMP